MAKPLLSPSGEFIPVGVPNKLPHIETTFVNINQFVLAGTNFFQSDFSLRFDAHQLPCSTSLYGHHIESGYLELSLIFDINTQKFVPPNSTSLHNFQTWNNQYSDGVDLCSLCKSARFKQQADAKIFNLALPNDTRKLVTIPSRFQYHQAISASNPGFALNHTPFLGQQFLPLNKW